MNKPIYLYKYVNIQTGISILKNLSLRFTQPNQLNDPFEMCAPIVSEDFCKLNCPDTFHTKLPGEEEEQDIIQIQSFDFQNEVLNHISRLYGIACFSTSSKNLLLWSHYANSHQGICIQFVLDNNFFESAKHFEVKYSNKRPVIDTSELYNNYDYLINQMSIKSRDWAYEKEYRFYSLLSGCTRICDTDIYTKTFDMANLGNVVLGYKCNKEDRTKIIKIMESYDKRNRVRQARLSTDVFNLFYDDDIDIEDGYVVGANKGTDNKKNFTLGSNVLVIKDQHLVLYSIKENQTEHEKLSDSKYYFDTGRVFFEESRYFEAIECFKKCYNLNKMETNAAAWVCYYIATSYYDLKDFSEAVIWYKETLQLNEYFIIAYKKLIFAYASRPHLGSLSSAWEKYFIYCSRCIEAGAEEIGVDILIFVAGMYYIYNEYDASLQICKKIKNIDINNTTAIEIEERINKIKITDTYDSNYRLLRPVRLVDNGVELFYYGPNMIGIKHNSY